MARRYHSLKRALAYSLNGLCATLLALPAAAGCKVGSDALGVEYRIEKRDLRGELRSSTPLTLWRLDSEVAHERPAQGLTDVWNRLPDGRLRPVRYFDEYRHGIEYQPGDIPLSDNWSKQSQLLSDEALSAMRLVATHGEGCYRTERYERALREGKLEVLWNPALKLLVRLDRSHAGGTTTLVTQALTTDRERVRQAMLSRADYQTTDFADIGDNESDPFLKRMIRLGFVSHHEGGHVH